MTYDAVCGCGRLTVVVDVPDYAILRAEIATLRALLAEARPYVASAGRLLITDGLAVDALLTRIDAALSPTVPTRPDLSPSQSPPPAGDSGGRETT